jgi:dTDP-4-amino-4,6-dideoxygalactose transaminase
MDTLTSYEAEFARVVNAQSARSFWKGRIALYAILKALKIGKGDEVLLPGFTCVVVPNAVRLCGATPVYVDINPTTYNMDPESLLHNLSAKSRAVIVQHTFGIPADMDPLIKVAERHQLHIIEDCAHAIGSTYKGRPVGSFGTAAFFSSQWSKPYTTGLGGIAVTSDPKLSDELDQIQSRFAFPPSVQVAKLYVQHHLYERAFTPRLYWHAMRTLSALSKLKIFVGSSSLSELGGVRPFDAEWRMSAFQARTGLKRLKELRMNQEHRSFIVEQYKTILRSKGWSLPEAMHCEPIFLRYPIRVDNKDELLRRAQNASIEMGGWFESVLHPIRDRLDQYEYRTGMCPTAELAATQLVNLPLHCRVSSDEAKRIAEFVCNFGEMPAWAKRPSQGAFIR